MSSSHNRISIRRVEPGMTVKYAYDSEDRLVTENVSVESIIDVQQLRALEVKSVILAEAEDPSEREGAENPEPNNTPVESILDEELESAPNLIRKSEKTYEQLVSHMQSVFQRFHDGEINLDGLYDLRPYLEKFIEFVDRSPASVSILTQIGDYDSVTYNHSINTSILGILYGKHRGFDRDDLLDLAFGCLVHDIGKIEISQTIINKQGPLTDEEFSVVRKHPLEGRRMLKEQGLDDEVVKMALEHHERPDGSGYPRGAKEVHRYSRILSVIDVYEAMTAPRSYKSSQIPIRAFRVLRDEFMDHDETRYIVDGLIHCLGIFPVGTLVRLTDGTIAIVQKNNPEDLTRPVVSIVANEENEVIDDPYLVDLDHVNQQKMVTHDHLYDDSIAIKSMIHPDSRSALREQINEVFDDIRGNDRYYAIGSRSL